MEMTWHHTHLPEGTAAAWHGPTLTHPTRPKLVFHHATAVGPRCYAPYLKALAKDYDVMALAMRPLWADAPPPDPKRGWDLFGDDLIHWIEATQEAPVLAVGHSIGAATLAMAARKRPELFRGLVLIEPSGATWRQALLLRSLPYALRLHLGPIKSALSTPTHWPSAEAAYAELRAGRAFRRFDDQALKSIVEGLLVNRHETVTQEITEVALEYPRTWEAHLYATAPHTLPVMTGLTVPTEILRGRPSLYMGARTEAKLKAKRPDFRFTHLTAHGHMMPLEAPIPVAEATRAALARLSA